MLNMLKYDLTDDYLKVDALCIDQSPDPTPEQLEAKIEQLNMMATIYGYAALTIVALTGQDSNAGLSGLSVPRPMQVKEEVNGHVLFTVPPDVDSEIERSTWSSRAWTLQEELISRRRLHFTECQVEFSCLLGSVWEGADMATFPKDYVAQQSGAPVIQMALQLTVRLKPDK